MYVIYSRPFERWTVYHVCALLCITYVHYCVSRMCVTVYQVCALLCITYGISNPHRRTTRKM